MDAAEADAVNVDDVASEVLVTITLVPVEYVVPEGFAELLPESEA